MIVGPLTRFMRYDAALLRCKRLMREAGQCTEVDPECGGEPCWISRWNNSCNTIFPSNLAEVIADGNSDINTWKPMSPVDGAYGVPEVYCDFSDWCEACRRKERLFRHRAVLTAKRTGALRTLRGAWRKSHDS